MIFTRLRLSVFVALVFNCGLLVAQQPADTIPELTLEQLLQLKALDSSSVTEAELNARLEISSQQAFSTREAPNVITIITADEIRNSGARDLMDVLRMVPGIEFGTDIEGAVSFGIRGQWAAEGKVLITIDGVEINEIMYGFFVFGNDFPVSTIKRVEVIRGPGSIVNGGFAAFGVINIITRDLTETTTVKATTSTGATQTGFSRAGADIMLNTKSRDGWYLSAKGSYSNALRSDQPYTDFNGDTYNMRLCSELKRRDAFFTLSGHGLNILLMYRQYETETLAPLGYIIRPDKFANKFTQYRGAITWNHKNTRGWTYNAAFHFGLDRPWEILDSIAGIPSYSRSGKRTRFSGSVGYKFSRAISLNFGLQSFIDQGRVLDNGPLFITNDSVSLVLRNQAAFGEVIWKTNFFNIIAGARAEFNSAYGSAFVPRLAITKNFERFSFKALINKSFRAPALEHYDRQDTAVAMRPELIWVTEIELGYKISRKAYVNVNFFRTDIRNQIQYIYDLDTQYEYYTNDLQQVSYGAEAEFIYRGKINQFRASWSFYSVYGMPVNDVNAVDDNENLLLNFPQHKLAITGTHIFPNDLAVNFTGQLVSARYFITSFDSIDEYVVERFSPDALLSATVIKKNVLPGFDVSVSIHNLLNRSYPMGVPYYDDLTPISSLSREFVLRLTWHPDFTKPASTDSQHK